MSLSVSGTACERFGSGGLGRPLWGVVAAGDWEVGAVGARSIVRTITIVWHSMGLPKVEHITLGWLRLFTLENEASLGSSQTAQILRPPKG